MLFAVGVLDLQADLEPAEVEARRLEFVGSVGIGAQRVDAEPVGFQFVVGNESVGRLRADEYEIIEAENGMRRQAASGVTRMFSTGLPSGSTTRPFTVNSAVGVPYMTGGRSSVLPQEANPKSPSK